jgi:hypothetical protein
VRHDAARRQRECNSKAATIHERARLKSNADNSANYGQMEETMQRQQQQKQRRQQSSNRSRRLTTLPPPLPAWNSSMLESRLPSGSTIRETRQHCPPPPHTHTCSVRALGLSEPDTPSACFWRPPSISLLARRARTSASDRLTVSLLLSRRVLGSEARVVCSSRSRQPAVHVVVCNLLITATPNKDR